jgi:hypothetical protein
VTLLAALLCEREQEVTDILVDLLIATVHRIAARAERRVSTSKCQYRSFAVWRGNTMVELWENGREVMDRHR